MVGGLLMNISSCRGYFNVAFKLQASRSILYIILRTKTPDKYATTAISRILCDQRSEATKVGDIKVCRNVGLEPIHLPRKG